MFRKGNEHEVENGGCRRERKERRQVGGKLCVYIYIYIIYTPNLGLEIACFVREKEQGRFRGSTEGARREQRGAARKQRGSRREQQGSRGSIEGAKREQGEQRGGIMGQYRGAVGGSLKWLLPSRLELPSLLFLLPRLRHFL